VGAPKSPVYAHPLGTASMLWLWRNHRRTSEAVLNRRKRRRRLQSGRPSLSEKTPSQSTLPLRKLSGPGLLPRSWIWGCGGIASSEGCVSLMPSPLNPQIQIPLLSRSRICPRSIKSPSPGRRPGLRSLSPNQQLPLSGCCKAQEDSSLVCRNRGRQTLNTQPGGPHTNLHLPI
jgi:hypothetical protein